MSEPEIITLIADILERRGAESYLGEAVTMAEHMLQTATLAEAAGAPEALVAAALLHDIGHFTSEFGSYTAADTIDRYHDDAGAKVLDGHFPALVVDCVRLHVAAKRYLCATEPEYHDGLSQASRHSLVLQGGVMSKTEIAAFRSQPNHEAAVQVRRWDDAGKVANTPTRSFADFRPILSRVLAGNGQGSPSINLA